VKEKNKIPCDIMTRTVGYYAVKKGMNRGIRAQVEDRKKYTPAEIQIAMRKEIKKGLDCDEMYT